MMNRSRIKVILLFIKHSKTLVFPTKFIVLKHQNDYLLNDIKVETSRKLGLFERTYPTPLMVSRGKVSVMPVTGFFAFTS